MPHSIRGLAASQHTFGAQALDIHPNMSAPFDPAFRTRLKAVIESSSYEAFAGVYIYNGGDTFETPEEVRCIDTSPVTPWRLPFVLLG